MPLCGANSQCGMAECGSYYTKQHHVQLMFLQLVTEKN